MSRLDLSIIMPVYNVEKYIEKSIASIIKQNNSKLEYELIIIDDGTKDKSINIAELLLSNSNLDYQIIHQNNSGVSVARNTGLAHAKGKYIFFLDSDDLISSDFMNSLSIEIDSDNDIIFWAFNSIDTNCKVLKSYFDEYPGAGKIYNNGIEVLKDILVERKQLIWTGSAVYSRNLLNKHNLLFNSKHINGEDQEFIFSALIYSNKVTYISDILSYYLIRDSSISTSFKTRKFDSVTALENVRDTLIRLRGPDDLLTNAINSYIVENFLYVYKSGLKVNSARHMVRQLNSLDNIYPKLQERIVGMMLGYRTTFLFNKLEVTIARSSLMIYGVLYKFFRKWKF